MGTETLVIRIPLGNLRWTQTLTGLMVSCPRALSYQPLLEGTVNALRILGIHTATTEPGTNGLMGKRSSKQGTSLDTKVATTQNNNTRMADTGQGRWLHRRPWGFLTNHMVYLLTRWPGPT